MSPVFSACHLSHDLKGNEGCEQQYIRIIHIKLTDMFVLANNCVYILPFNADLEKQL